jgi:putative acetyltransferase
VSINFTVRSYRKADHKALIRFLEGAFSELGKQFLPELKDSDIRNIEAVYLNGRGSFHVVEVDGQICGSIGIRSYSDTIAELKRLYIARDLRGIGLGEALCKKAIEDAKELGYSHLRLDTTFRSKAAIKLFLKLGFKQIDRYNPNPVAEMFFEKSL